MARGTTDRRRKSLGPGVFFLHGFARGARATMGHYSGTTCRLSAFKGTLEPHLSVEYRIPEGWGLSSPDGAISRDLALEIVISVVEIVVSGREIQKRCVRSSSKSEGM